VAEAFNPYRQWLGLDTEQTPPDHYQLLDLAPFEPEISKIHTAADRALARVRSHRPGPHAPQWARLLDQLTEAKGCLTDPARKARYDAQLQAAETSKQAATEDHGDRSEGLEIAAVNQLPDLFPPGMAPLPPAGSATPGLPARSAESAATKTTAPKHSARPAATPGRPRRQRPPQPPAAPSDSAHGEHPATSEPLDDSTHLVAPLPPAPVNAHVAPPRREQPSLLPVLASITVVLIVTTLVVLSIAMRDSFSGAAATPDPPDFANKPSPTAAGGGVEVESSSESAGSGLTRPQRRSATRSPGGTIGAGTNARDELSKSKPNAAAAVARPRAKPSTGDERLRPTANRAKDAAEVPASTSGNTGDSQTAAARLSEEELEQLQRSLQAARQALRARDFTTAQQQLDAAAALADHSPHKPLVARLTRLGRHAREFWSVVASAVDRLEGLEELTFGDGALRVLVVESGDGWISVRHNGKNARYTIDEMPVELALAVAKTRLDTRKPEDLLLLGAGLATASDPKPRYVEHARRYWQQAQAAGGAADELLKTLDDSYQLAP
jgi:hypothetical protein